jgi:hypothetical protein
VSREERKERRAREREERDRKNRDIHLVLPFFNDWTETARSTGSTPETFERWFLTLAIADRMTQAEVIEVMAAFKRLTGGQHKPRMRLADLGIGMGARIAVALEARRPKKIAVPPLCQSCAKAFAKRQCDGKLLCEACAEAPVGT